MTLKDKIKEFKERGNLYQDVIPAKDVKEFIRLLKASMLFTPSPTERGEFIKWLGREIDKLSGFSE